MSKYIQCFECQFRFPSRDTKISHLVTNREKTLFIAVCDGCLSVIPKKDRVMEPSEIDFLYARFFYNGYLDDCEHPRNTAFGFEIPITLDFGISIESAKRYLPYTARRLKE